MRGPDAADLSTRVANMSWGEALTVIVGAFQADIGTIHLLRSDGALHLEAHTEGIPERVLEASRRIPVGKGIAGQAVLLRKPVSMCNLQTDASSTVPAGARLTAARGSLCVPILRDAEAIGALGIATMVDRTFTEEEVTLLLDTARALAKTPRSIDSVGPT